MIRRILLLLVVLAIPAGLATASQVLANTANPQLPHQQPIVVKLTYQLPPSAQASIEERNHDED